MRIALDLFCGSGSFGKVARTYGYEVISLDNRRRKGTCEPTLKTSILDIPDTFFNSLNPQVIWIGLPCTIWSRASGGFHLSQQFEPLTALAVTHLAILNKVLRILDNLPRTKFVIENPRGKLRNFPPFRNWLDQRPAYIYYCTLSSFGFPTTKPTDLFSNMSGLVLPEPDPFGRGYKNKVPGTFDNMTVVQRQKTPQLLIRKVLDQV